MSHRAAAKVAKCSHGSISLEKKIMRQEEQERTKIEKENARKIAAGETLILDESTPW
jgi:hypothetical protein